MRDIKNLNIWKQEETLVKENEIYLQMDILDLGLSVRSYNCLKRANCNTVRDILDYIGEDEHGLMKIRNLGKRSEQEIKEKLQEFKIGCRDTHTVGLASNKRIIRPSIRIWDKEIDEYPISDVSKDRLKNCGVYRIRDLYAVGKVRDPGWYAVRELFDKIPNYR